MGGVIGVSDPGVSAEGLVNDESTAVTLSNPAEKDEVAAQRVVVPPESAQCACGAGSASDSVTDSFAAQLKTPRAMVDVARVARAANTC